MLEQAYSGVGWIGNDMYSPFDAGYPNSLPQRDQDLEQAAALLKQAGYDGLSIELVTSDAIGNGAVAQAQVFAEQAKGAGVDVKVNKVESGVLWGDDYMSWTFFGDWFSYRNYLQMAAIATMPDAPYNASHWKNAKWQAIVEEAMRTADDDRRNEMVAEASTIEFEEGGLVIPSFKNQLDAYSVKVKGLVEGDRMGTPLGRWRLHQVYIG
jgi:peptide/nickel transport system substrate-binding protein